ncbi:MAG: phage holin family protein [Thermosynechococcaceae cyanobacterium]
MSWLISVVITVLVTSISLFILSKLPLGIEIDSFGKAVWSAIVFGILNAIAQPLFWLLKGVNWITLGLFFLILNGIIFGLAAMLVEGFRLKWGFWSALLGALVLSVLNSIIFTKVLPLIGLGAV